MPLNYIKVLFDFIDVIYNLGFELFKHSDSHHLVLVRFLLNLNRLLIFFHFFSETFWARTHNVFMDAKLLCCIIFFFCLFNFLKTKGQLIFLLCSQVFSHIHLGTNPFEYIVELTLFLCTRIFKYLTLKPINWFYSIPIKLTCWK